MLWEVSTYGGKVAVGKFSIPCHCHFITANTDYGREWDVAAGICLLKEAGGLVTTANPPGNLKAPIEDALLGGRLYLAIRPAGDSPSELARQGQERTVREVWRRVRKLDYTRPGI